VSSKYEFIDGEKDNYPITKMCDWLAVSRAGFYDWLTRAESATEARRARLKAMITTVFDANHAVYGHRRVHAVLTRSGQTVSVELVRALMRELGLVTRQPRPWRPVTIQAGAAHTIPDLAGRDFTAERPGAKLVGDITYIATGEGFLYLATVIDCHTKMIVGWSMADHYKTSLICSALDMAADTIALEPGCVFHSDRGSNYTSYEYAKKLKAMDLRQSVGRTGVCWDNAMAESFFSALKNEWLHHMTFVTHGDARQAVVKYIVGFYNRTRLHSALGYRTPLEVLNEYHDSQLAA
jgi:putative transposase